MHRTLCFLAALALASPALAAAPDGGVPAAAKPEVPVGPLKTADDKTLYVLGYAAGRNPEVMGMNLTKAEAELMKKGFSDALAGNKPLVPLQEYGQRFQAMMQTRQPLAAAARAKKDQPVLDKAAKEKGAQVTADGLVYIPIQEGTGASPKPTDVVKMAYKGSLANGTEFDNSAKHAQVPEFPLDRVIPCWSEGAQKMKVGGKAKFVCPASIGYKEKGEPRGGIPGGAVLVFEVELLEVKPPPPPPPTPAPGAATTPAK
jgi:FKBP-type peptidyl-prolyl cis-trans isomerase FkpA